MLQSNVDGRPHYYPKPRSGEKIILFISLHFVISMWFVSVIIPMIAQPCGPIPINMASKIVTGENIENLVNNFQNGERIEVYYPCPNDDVHFDGWGG